VETVSISLAPAGVAGLYTHARSMFICEHHNLRAKAREEQSKAVCLRAWQFESESKTRAE